MEVKNKLCKRQQQLFCFEIFKRAPSILESGEWTDCKFMVGAEPHQVVVGGYKLVMAFASPVFEAMFYGSLAETSDTIPIVDVEPEIFIAMLQYMYTDNINISSWSEACQLYYAAKKYMLKQLMEQCSKYLRTQLNVGNVCQIYEHALLFEDEAIKEDCKKMFSDKTSDLLKDNSFTAAELTTVTTIFSLDTLNLDSKLDLIEAAARYAETQDIKLAASRGSCTSVDEIDKQLTCGHFNLKIDKQLIRSLIRNIRFLSLTPRQYASCAARNSLLTPSEDHVLLLNIAYDKSDVPMPSGCSTSRVSRVRTEQDSGKGDQTLFDTRIECFIGDTEYSQEYYFRKLKWQIKLVPNYPGTWAYLYFSVLCTNERPTSSSWSCDASAELRIISHVPRVKPLICNIQHVFSKQNKEKRTTRKFTADDLHDYLKNGSIEIQTLIKINKLVDI